MVVIIKHKHVKKFLKITIAVFDRFKLIFNPKKSAIVNIKNFADTWPAEKIHNIPYTQEYKFLGIKIDEKGNIGNHI